MHGEAEWGLGLISGLGVIWTLTEGDGGYDPSPLRAPLSDLFELEKSKRISLSLLLLLGSFLSSLGAGVTNFDVRSILFVERLSGSRLELAVENCLFDEGTEYWFSLKSFSIASDVRSRFLSSCSERSMDPSLFGSFGLELSPVNNKDTH